MELNEAQRKFAYFFSKLIQWAFVNRYEVVIGEVERTEYQQREYLRTGRSKTMDSNHLKKCAGDLLLFKTPASDYGYITDGKEYKPLGEYWASLDPHCRWGGDFRKDGDKTTSDSWDSNHFEYHV